jgi:hypothetical protein
MINEAIGDRQILEITAENERLAASHEMIRETIPGTITESPETAEGQAPAVGELASRARTSSTASERSAPPAARLHAHGVTGSTSPP